MKRLMTRSLLALVAFSCILSLAKAAEWGTLKGQFILDGTPPTPKKVTADKDQEACGKDLVEETLTVDPASKGIADIFLSLKTEKVASHPDYEKSAKDDVVLDNKECRFIPHALVLRTTQKLVVKNSDPVSHNSKGSPLKNAEFNPIISPNDKISVTLTKAEARPFPVTCSIHKWMGARVLVCADPYGRVSDKEGKFEIENLPAGTELEFRVQHEAVGNVADLELSSSAKTDKKGIVKIKITPGVNDLGQIKVPLKAVSK